MVNKKVPIFFLLGAPFLTIQSTCEQVERLSQGISEGWAFHLQVRKYQTEQFALFLDFRTFKQAGRLGNKWHDKADSHFNVSITRVAGGKLLIDVVAAGDDFSVLAVIDLFGNIPLK